MYNIDLQLFTFFCKFKTLYLTNNQLLAASWHLYSIRNGKINSFSGIIKRNLYIALNKHIGLFVQRLIFLNGREHTESGACR